MRFEDLTAEQIEQAKECKTVEEQMEFLHSVGVELTDEQLEDIAGGKSGSRNPCPNGGTHEWESTGMRRPSKSFGRTWPDREERCKKCGKTRWVSSATLLPN